eukprot:scaffold2601_cov117-Isochrysis_galbana.AAC.8
MPSSKDGASRSADTFAMASVYMSGSSAPTSCVTSTRIAASVMVMRVTPHSTAAAPMSASRPASPSEVPGSTSPRNRPSAAPRVSAGMKLPAGTEMPKTKTATKK